MVAYLRPVPSRLERHRLGRAFAGIPYFDEDGTEIGLVAEPEWTFGDLGPRDEEELGSAFYAALEANEARPPGGRLSPERVYAAVLSEYGVACPHWPHHRADLVRGGRVRGQICGCCDAWIVAATGRL